jgi:hypothetical protein
MIGPGGMLLVVSDVIFCPSSSFMSGVGKM